MVRPETWYILGTILLAAAGHALFVRAEFPFATGIAFAIALWGGRVWGYLDERMQDAR